MGLFLFLVACNTPFMGTVMLPKVKRRDHVTVAPFLLVYDSLEFSLLYLSLLIFKNAPKNTVVAEIVPTICSP